MGGRGFQRNRSSVAHYPHTPTSPRPALAAQPPMLWSASRPKRPPPVRARAKRQSFGVTEEHGSGMPAAAHRGPVAAAPSFFRAARGQTHPSRREPRPPASTRSGCRAAASCGPPTATARSRSSPALQFVSDPIAAVVSGTAGREGGMGGCEEGAFLLSPHTMLWLVAQSFGPPAGSKHLRRQRSSLSSYQASGAGRDQRGWGRGGIAHMTRTSHDARGVAPLLSGSSNAECLPQRAWLRRVGPPAQRVDVMRRTGSARRRRRAARCRRSGTPAPPRVSSG